MIRFLSTFLSALLIGLAGTSATSAQDLFLKELTQDILRSRVGEYLANPILQSQLQEISKIAVLKSEQIVYTRAADGMPKELLWEYQTVGTPVPGDSERVENFAKNTVLSNVLGQKLNIKDKDGYPLLFACVIVRPATKADPILPVVTVPVEPIPGAPYAPSPYTAGNFTSSSGDYAPSVASAACGVSYDYRPSFTGGCRTPVGKWMRACGGQKFGGGSSVGFATYSAVSTGCSTCTAAAVPVVEAGYSAANFSLPSERPDESLKIWEAALDRNVDDAAAWSFKASLEWKMNRVAEATESARRAAALALLQDLSPADRAVPLERLQGPARQFLSSVTPVSSREEAMRIVAKPRRASATGDQIAGAK